MAMQIESRDVLSGLAIPFGSPGKRDLQGEWFSKRTDLHLEWFPTDGRPVLYHHGLDDKLSGGLIGRQTSHEVDEDGLWVEVQLEKRGKYVELLRQLLDKGALGFSSGALPSLVKTDKSSGEILSWPWVELSTTPTPASADARIMASKYLADLGSNHLAAIEAKAQYLRLAAATDRPPGGRNEPDAEAIAQAAAKRFAETGDLAGALDEIIRAVRGTPAPIDPYTNLPDPFGGG